MCRAGCTCRKSSSYSDEEIRLHFYPYCHTEYIFREDDGVSLDYEENMSCHTLITCDCEEDCVKIHIGKRMGNYHNKPEERTWLITVHGTNQPVQITSEDNYLLCDG